MPHTSKRPPGKLCAAKKTVDACLYDTNEQLQEEHVIHSTTGNQAEGNSLHIFGESISPQHRNDDHHEDNLAGQNKMKRMLWCGLSPLVVTFPNTANKDAPLVTSSAAHRSTPTGVSTSAYMLVYHCWVLQVRMHDHHHTNMLRGAAVPYDTSAPCAPCSSHEHTGTRDVLVVMNVT